MITTGCSSMNGMARQPVVLSIFLIAVLLLLPAHAQDSALGQRMILNVYLDSSGKALVTGYAENVSGLTFLNSNNSQVRFENNSHQLYALTAGLTTKVGDLWTLHFDANGLFDDYRVTFYLPNETLIGAINTSQGLGYLLSASNESLVADVQGWEVSDPQISIQYQQPLASNGKSLPPPPGYPGEGTALVMLFIAALLMVAGFGFAIVLQRKRRISAASPTMGQAKTMNEAATADMAREETAKMSQAAFQSTPAPVAAPQSHDAKAPSGAENTTLAPPPTEEDDGIFLLNDDLASAPPAANETEPKKTPILPPSQPSEPAPAKTQELLPAAEPKASEAPGDEASAAIASETATAQEKTAETAIAPATSIAQEKTVPAVSEAAGAIERPKNEIVISSEMDAVMQTLTARERAVMSTLIAHGGRMTQAEIRYETGTPKSSLTGILISLERRKLVIKKEWGRTNIIELSEWFLSKKEHS